MLGQAGSGLGCALCPDRPEFATCAKVFGLDTRWDMLPYWPFREGRGQLLVGKWIEMDPSILALLTLSLDVTLQAQHHCGPLDLR